MKREKTGITGIDKMMQGGFPQNSIVGLSGPPGVGKSIFALHYLLEGAKQGQKCVYINLEEPEKNIKTMIQQFSFSKDFTKYVKKGLIVIKCYTYPEYEKIYSELLQKIHTDEKIKRLVVDTFNCFFTSTNYPESFSITNQLNVRRMINNAFAHFRRQDMTTLLVLEMEKNNPHSIYFNIPHLVDGMINLDFLELGTIERRIFIPKMRWTNQHKESKQYNISKRGIQLYEE